MRKIIFFFTTAAITIIHHYSYARWINADEAKYSVEQSKLYIHVNKDGSYSQTIERVEKIMNEAGRSFGNLTLTYNPKNEKIKVLEAKIKNADGWTSVSKKNISDQAIRQSENGFDDTRQILISYPSVLVGSELFYKYKIDFFHPTIKNRFGTSIGFSTGALWKHSEVEVESEIPLYMEVNDPRQMLEVKTDESGKTKKYQLRLKAPLVEEIVDEVQILFDNYVYTFVNFSSAKDYETYYSPLANLYDQRLSETLPQEVHTIIQETEQSKNSVDRIAKIMELLAKQFRYMGDWRGVNGALVPRTLRDILSTHSGDCKDLSLLLTKILREIGINAQIALIYRGESSPKLTKLPIFSFNHAIVYAKIEGQELWLDPTNFAIYPTGIPADIAGRSSLLLTGDKPQLMNVPFTAAENNKEQVVYSYSILKGSILKANVKLHKAGILAVENTGAYLQYSKQQFEDATVYNFVTPSDLIDVKMVAPELSSRIVAPLDFSIDWKERFKPSISTHGPALRATPSRLIFDIADLKTKGRISGLKLAYPMTTHNLVQLKNVGVHGNELTNCSVKSPWIHFDFKIDYLKNTYEINEVIKANFIANSELQSKKFLVFQEQLKNCARARYIVYK